MRVAIWGAGGHGKVVYDVLTSERHRVVAWLDDRDDVTERYGIPLVGCEDRQRLRDRYADLHVVVAVGDNAARARIYRLLRDESWSMLSAVHPSAVVHESVQVGDGSIVMPGAVINIDSVVGENCIVNTSASIDHDCHLSAHVHVGPGVRLAGTVTVEEGAFIGIGSCIIPNLRIGSWSVVGAGAAVTRDVPAGATVIGVPARVKPKPTST